MTRMHRIALHNHSDWSYDGSWSLPAIARLFGAAGFDAVMMSEHDTGFDPASFGAYREACAAASTKRCKIIPGIEYSSPDNRIHILTWGLEHFLAEHRPVLETLEAVKAAGGVAIFAHPVRKEAWSLFESDWVPLLSGIELWNRKSDGIVPGRQAQSMIKEHGLPATVGCDFHRLRNFYPLSNRLPVMASGVTEEGLVAAIAAGSLAPYAFGSSLLDAAGAIKPLEGHYRAERWRKRILTTLRPSKSKKT